MFSTFSVCEFAMIGEEIAKLECKVGSFVQCGWLERQILVEVSKVEGVDAGSVEELRIREKESKPIRFLPDGSRRRNAVLFMVVEGRILVEVSKIEGANGWDCDEEGHTALQVS
jgi:hypothetical protein